MISIRSAPRSFAILVLLLLTRPGMGQCIMVNSDPNQSFIAGGCDQFGGGQAIGAIRWTGGTGPFHVSFFGSFNHNEYNVSGSPYYFQVMVGGYTDLTNVQVFVEDGFGCDGAGMVENLNGTDIVDELIGMFTIDLTATNCAAGLFTATCTHDQQHQGDIFAQPLTGYTYALTKNGATQSSGALSTVYQSNPSRLVFPGLTGGSYVLEVNTTNGTGQNTLYCPRYDFFPFCVPMANDCQTQVAVRMALQGALPSGTVMQDALRTGGLVPLAEPYSALGYAYVGIAPGASTTAPVLAINGNNAVVDWVVVELRNAAAPYPVVSSRPALLQRDGDVVDRDGDPYIAFPMASGNYRVAVRHRNHLGVMTGAAYALGIDPCRTPIDLRLSTTGTYGTNARKLVGSVQCLWAGDATGDGTVKYAGGGNDRDPILTAIGGAVPTATITGQYRAEDVNLDGQVKYAGSANDRDIILQNIGGSVPTATRTQQLP